MVEPAGVPAATVTTALGYSLWSLWLITTGTVLLCARPEANETSAASRLHTLGTVQRR